MNTAAVSHDIVQSCDPDGIPTLTNGPWATSDTRTPPRNLRWLEAKKGVAVSCENWRVGDRCRAKKTLVRRSGPPATRGQEGVVTGVNRDSHSLGKRDSEARPFLRVCCFACFVLSGVLLAVILVTRACAVLAALV